MCGCLLLMLEAWRMCGVWVYSVWPKRVYYIWCLWSSEVWLVYLKRSCIIVFVTFWNIMSSVFHGLVFTLFLSVLFYSLLLFFFFLDGMANPPSPKTTEERSKILVVTEKEGFRFEFQKLSNPRLRLNLEWTNGILIISQKHKENYLPNQYLVTVHFSINF